MLFDLTRIKVASHGPQWKLLVAPLGQRGESRGIEGTTSVLFLASLTGKIENVVCTVARENRRRSRKFELMLIVHVFRLSGV
mgnify:CR=1 FL=1